MLKFPQEYADKREKRREKKTKAGKIKDGNKSNNVEIICGIDIIQICQVRLTTR